MFHSKSLLSLALLLGLISSSWATEMDEWGDDAAWEEESWEEEAEVSSPWHGFVDLGWGQFVDHSNPTKKNQSLAEARMQLETTRYFGEVESSATADLVVDGVTDEVNLELRTAFINLTPGDNFDLRIGRQILTWGTGDLLFLNDLFPKDWQSFFSGRDMEYLKAPADAARLTWYNPQANIDIAWVPLFEPDNFLTGERFSYFSPMAGTIVAAPPKLQTIEPSHSAENGELALRIYQTHNNIEWALYAYRGFYKQPTGFDPSSGKNIFPSLSAYGASVRAPVHSGIGNIEMVYYDSRDDRDGTDPLKPNSQWQLLLGYEQELITRLTVSAQYYLQVLMDHHQLKAHSPTPQFEPNKRHHTLTSRLTYRMQQDKLRLSLFVFYSPDNKDGYLLPSVNYRYNDSWSLTAGGNWFFGDEKHTFFGQLQDNNNVYTRLTYHY